MLLHKPLQLLRAIKGGNRSDTKDQVVEPAEVHRIYPVATAAVDARLADLYKLVDDLRADRDAWREHAQRLALRVPPSRHWWWSRASAK
jgi:hypothetical protein